MQYMILFLVLSIVFVYKFNLIGFVIVNIVLNVFLFLVLFGVVGKFTHICPLPSTLK